MASDESVMLVAFSALLGIFGVVTALSKPFLGFTITGAGLFIGLFLTFREIANAFNVDRIPIDERAPSIIIGSITLLSFIPLLLPTFVTFVGAMAILYGVGFVAYQYYASSIDGDTILTGGIWAAIGLFWLYLANSPRFTAVGILVMVLAFGYTLLPDETKETINQVSPLS